MSSLPKRLEMNPEEFGTWLSKFGDEDVVGRACEYCACPIAHYVRQKLQDENPGQVYTVAVSSSSVYVILGEQPEDYMKKLMSDDLNYYSTPRWCGTFVSAVDEKKEHGEAITAMDARDALGYALDAATGAEPSLVL